MGWFLSNSFFFDSTFISCLYLGGAYLLETLPQPFQDVIFIHSYLYIDITFCVFLTLDCFHGQILITLIIVDGGYRAGARLSAQGRFSVFAANGDSIRRYYKVNNRSSRSIGFLEVMRAANDGDPSRLQSENASGLVRSKQWMISVRGSPPVFGIPPQPRRTRRWDWPMARGATTVIRLQGSLLELFQRGAPTTPPCPS